MDSIDIVVLTIFAIVVAIYFNKSLITELILGSRNTSDTLLGNGSRDITEVFKLNNKNFLVMFGSQTGTAEDYAKSFSKELASKFGLNVLCVDLDDYDFDNLNSLPQGTITAIFMSTYGEGEVPDNAFNFEKFLKQGEKLNNINYMIFGLGNSTYELFNGAARNIQKLLKKNGAKQLHKIGLADDGAATTDEDYLTWKENVMELIKNQLKIDEKDLKFNSNFKLIEISNLDDNIYLGEPSEQYLPDKKIPFNKEKNVQTGPFNLTYPFVAPIIESKDLFKSTDKSTKDNSSSNKNENRNCIHAEFDVSGSNLKYSTGDHLAIWPSNANEKVEQFIKVFNLNKDKIFDLKAVDVTNKLPFPCPTTIGAAITYYLEITGPVSRQFLTNLIQFVNEDEDEENKLLKDKMIDLSKDKDLFAKEITAKFFNIADMLENLAPNKKWDNIPWLFLIENISKLSPRYYSISSSALSEKQIIHITAIVENEINEFDEDRPTLGVTTNLLRNISEELNEKEIVGKENDKTEIANEKDSDNEESNEEKPENNEKKPVKNQTNTNLPVHYNLNGPRNLYSNFKLPIHVRKSPFKLPANHNTPIIMIGPGTGIAPFRGFIRERVKYLELNPNVNLGKQLLFYGCRNDNDFLYKNEWEDYKFKLGKTFQMVVAQSRVKPGEKVYVQDKLKEMEDEIIELLKSNAFVYVCGDAKGMSKQVHDTLVGIISRGLKIDENAALEMVKIFRNTGRYQEDVW